MYTSKFLCAFLLSSAICRADQLIEPGGNPRLKETREIFSLSFVKLLARPERYNNKIIMLEGVFSYHPEETGMYMSREFFDERMSQYWIPLNFSKVDPALQRYDGKYVEVTGVYDLVDSDNDPSGIIHSISHISAPLDDGWPTSAR